MNGAPREFRLWQTAYDIAPEVAAVLADWLAPAWMDASPVPCTRRRRLRFSTAPHRHARDTGERTSDGAWVIGDTTGGERWLRSALAGWPSFEMYTDGNDIVVHHEPGALARVVPIVCKQVLEAEMVGSGGSVLHASSAVGDRLGATLFVGDAHAGKTTSALALATQGSFISGDRTLIVRDGKATYVLTSLQDTRLRRSTATLLGLPAEGLTPRRPSIRRDGQEKLVLSPLELACAGLHTVPVARAARIVVLVGRATGHGVAERMDAEHLRADFERQVRAPWSPLTAPPPPASAAFDAVSHLPWWRVTWGPSHEHPIDLSAIMER